MKAVKNEYGEYAVVEGESRYFETEPAQPTSRSLNGSRDTNYDVEYVGYGEIDGIPVIAVYLFRAEDWDNDDEDSWDWEHALKRIIVDVDKLSDQQYDQLMQGKEIGNVLL